VADLVFTPPFTPQPYPLYALTLVKQDNPVRFQPTEPAVRLVVGWVAGDDAALARPVLAGVDGLTAWDGIASYYPARETAEAMATQFAKASRSEVRSQRVQDWLAAFEAKLDKVHLPRT